MKRNERCRAAPGRRRWRRRRGGWACPPGTRSVPWGSSRRPPAPGQEAAQCLTWSTLQLTSRWRCEKFCYFEGRLLSRPSGSALALRPPKGQADVVQRCKRRLNWWQETAGRLQLHSKRGQRTLKRRRRLSRPAVSSSWPLGWNSTDCTTAVLGSALFASVSGVTCGAAATKQDFVPTALNEIQSGLAFGDNSTDCTAASLAPSIDIRQSVQNSRQTGVSSLV